MKGKNIAYVRVSTVEQNEERQINTLKQYSIDKWFIDKCSGKNTDRPQFKQMLDYVREYDRVYIVDFSRLSRSTKDLLNTIELFESKNVSLISVKEALDTSTPTGKLMLTMIGAINEFERANILERQKEGIQIAKAKGVYKGRKPVEITDKFEELYDDYMKRKISKTQMAKELHICRNTLNKLIKEYEANK